MARDKTETNELPENMRAAAVTCFGGPEEFEVSTVLVPEIGPDEVLIRVEAAGVGVWDPYEREGQMMEALPEKPTFPYVMGSDGAGEVAAVGDDVTRFSPGDRVYALGHLNPKATFYAEYAVVGEDAVSRIPGDLSFEQAGAMPADGITALRGLEEVLQVNEGDDLMIFGASGGIGHIAVQLAKRLGARVLAVASGEDGVRLAERLGADQVVEGHDGDVAGAAREFAPDGLDAVLATAGGEQLDRALRAVRDGGRVAYPSGVQPEPEAPEHVRVERYDGAPNRARIERLNELIEMGPFEVHVEKTYPLEQAEEAHRRLNDHFLGKLALRPRG